MEELKPFYVEKLQVGYVVKGPKTDWLWIEPTTSEAMICLNGAYRDGYEAGLASRAPEADGLMEAIQKYRADGFDHRDRCPVRDSSGPCSCGMKELIAVLPPSAHATKEPVCDNCGFHWDKHYSDASRSCPVGRKEYHGPAPAASEKACTFPATPHIGHECEHDAFAKVIICGFMFDSGFGGKLIPCARPSDHVGRHCSVKLMPEDERPAPPPEEGRGQEKI